MNTDRREQGQVLVLIVLAIVGMLGFAALAVDLGRVFAERRRAQNAADSAVMAAANAGAAVDVSLRQNTAITAADAQLRLNDYDDDSINVDNGERIEIQVYSPPISGVYAGDPEYYQVIIYEDVEKVFSQFVFGGLLDFTVEAVANGADSAGMFEGNAIVATSPDSCGSLMFHGTSDIQIENGGAFSVSSRTGQEDACSIGAATNGGSSCTSGIRDGDTSIFLDEGFGIDLNGRWFENSSTGGVYQVDEYGNITQPPLDDMVNECEPVFPVPELPAPICGAEQTPVQDPITGFYTMNPGTYTSWVKFNGTDPRVHLNPGVYCLENGITFLAGSITGDRVMFYVEGGNFDLGGQATANFQSIVDEVGAVYPDGTVDPDFQWGGMLIYMPYENTGIVQIGAGSFSRYTGTIFAPGPTQTEGQIKCVIGGNSGTLGLASSILCYTVKIGGGATINIDYNADANFKFPPSLSLSQ